MRMHPQIGMSVLAPLDVPPVVHEVVLHHHERWDGTGYPERLSGEDIPLSARVFAVCDALDAMTAPRPYRTALSATAAYEHIRAEAGTHFDPDVVRTLERGVESGDIALEQVLEDRPMCGAAA
jgi:HD-GYP domain-containing protein (c-di-GMP phosphodiesterase class II)